MIVITVRDAGVTADNIDVQIYILFKGDKTKRIKVE